MDTHDLWQAGRSTTSRAWLTNPARNSLFIVARCCEAVPRRDNPGAQQFVGHCRPEQEDLDRILSAIAAMQTDLAALTRLSLIKAGM